MQGEIMKLRNKASMAAIATLVLTLSCGILNTENDALSALTAAGFTNPRVESKHVVFPEFHKCGKGDAAAFTCSAENQNHVRVQMAVCCGFFKGCTIRY
jgi:hypothetical protein